MSADLPGEAPTDRQVVDVLVVPDLVVSTLQGTQVKLVAASGVANPAVVACNRTDKLVIVQNDFYDSSERCGDNGLAEDWLKMAANLCSSEWGRLQAFSR